MFTRRESDSNRYLAIDSNARAQYGRVEQTQALHYLSQLCERNYFLFAHMRTARLLGGESDSFLLGRNGTRGWHFVCAKQLNNGGELNLLIV
jgi:hypothetical protein